MPSSTRSDDGQATVELALLLPLVVVFVCAVLQVALVGRDQLVLELAAREAARAAAVSAEPDTAARLAADRVTTLAPLGVEVRVQGAVVTVTVRHVNPTDVPLAGRLLGDVQQSATATMALEPP